MIAALATLIFGVIAVVTFSTLLLLTLANATRHRRNDPDPDWPVSNVVVTEKGRGL